MFIPYPISVKKSDAETGYQDNVYCSPEQSLKGARERRWSNKVVNPGTTNYGQIVGSEYVPMKPPFALVLKADA